MNIMESLTQANSSPQTKIVMLKISKTFMNGEQQIPVLKDINLQIKEGEFVSILGPSGSGKTTLLHMMGGLLEQTSGHIVIDGEVIDGPNEKVGFMFQKVVLLPWRTVEQNMILPVEVAKGDLVAAKRRVGELFELFGLSGFENYYIKQLPDDIQQRISLARTLMTDPDILLLDEPFEPFDDCTREKLNFSLMNYAEKRGKTVILVTHKIDEAVLISDRVIVMGIHPGHVMDDVKIEIPKPRTIQKMDTKEYVKYVEHLHELLEVGR